MTTAPNRLMNSFSEHGSKNFLAGAAVNFTSGSGSGSILINPGAGTTLHALMTAVVSCKAYLINRCASTSGTDRISLYYISGELTYEFIKIMSCHGLPPVRILLRGDLSLKSKKQPLN